MLATTLALLAVVAAPAPAARGAPGTLRVAAAANLKLAMDELARAFEAERPGVEVKITTGASGNFLAQIQNGAPFDVFFSADREYPRKIVEAGLAAPGAGEVVYAVGKLVVWTPRGSPVDVARRGLAALADPAVRKIAIANPAVAPYGRAARAALEAAKVLDAVEGRLVLGQNVSQAAQFVQSGAADAAFIPLSLTFAPELQGGNVHHVALGAGAPLDQSAVVLRSARDLALAQAFLAWVTGPRGREILARSGYGSPPR